MRKKREMQQRKEATSQVVKILYFLFKDSTLLIILFVTHCVLIMSKIKFLVKKKLSKLRDGSVLNVFLFSSNEIR